MANSKAGESVIHRVVRLLSAFSRGSTADKGVRELSRETGLPVATVHRMVSELEAEGMLVKNDLGRWQHGYRLWEIASRGSEILGLREAALSPMEDLLINLDAHVSLGVLEGFDVLYIERLSPAEEGETVNITQVAGRLPTHACSSGLVLTAFGPSKDQELLQRRKLKKYTSDTVIDAGRLRSMFAEIRQNGYSVGKGIIIPESSGIAVPVFGTEGKAVAALSVIVPVGKENLPVVVPQLVLAARAISRRLGYKIDAPHSRHSLHI